MSEPSPSSRFPEPQAIGLSAESRSTLRRLICEAIEAPPFNNRMMSSKAFSFLMNSPDRAELFRPLRDMLFDMFRTTAMHDRANAITGGEYVLLIDNCSMRRHLPDTADSALGFHFDGMFLGRQAPAYNLWVTLDDVGETVPGLGFLDDPDVEARLWDSFSGLLDRVGDRTIDPNHLDRLIDDRTRRFLSEHMICPRVAAGDGLLFDHKTLHVTQPLSGWSGERVSIEYRFCRRGEIPELYACKPRNTARFEGDANDYRVIVETVAPAT